MSDTESTMIKAIRIGATDLDLPELIRFRRMFDDGVMRGIVDRDDTLYVVAFDARAAIEDEMDRRSLASASLSELHSLLDSTEPGVKEKASGEIERRYAAMLGD